MQSKLGLMSILVYVCIFLVLTACENDSKLSVPIPSQNVTIPPIYTPIIEETLRHEDLPSSAVFVTIEELVTNPEKYEDEFIEIQGLNGGFIGKPDCEGWIGSPAEWSLAAAKTEYVDNVVVEYSPGIGIENTFNGIINSPTGADGWALRNPMMKKVVVWGWLRLYEGPVGCLGDQEIQHQVWYINAVQLQFLESIEVDRN